MAQVLEEESDRVEEGVYLSHFELYRAAMLGQSLLKLHAQHPEGAHA